jgi:hypothetical protein
MPSLNEDINSDAVTGRLRDLAADHLATSRDGD